MSNKFKVCGYVEGFDLYDDAVVYTAPSTRYRALALGILAALFITGAAIVISQ